MSVLELLVWMTVNDKSFLERCRDVENYLKKFPKECANCGKTLTAPDVIGSRFQCMKCARMLEKLSKKDQEKQKNL